MLSRLLHLLFSFFLLLLLADCAKIGSPAGGPRDEAPPKVLKSNPLNRSVNFKEGKIEITFDEYIRTEALGQELVVSPPLEERPEIRLKGKTLIIDWDEDLRDSTTYTFSFGEAIQDLNEGNILRNFEFVFSTGEHLDSLAVIGTVLQAFNLQPLEERVYLLLYENHSDSAPLLEIPDYVSVADPNGNFLINNVRPSTYRLFALQDLNRNYKYDVPEEYIGFLDSCVYLDPSIFTSLADTFMSALPDTDSLPPTGAEDTLSFALGEVSDFSMSDSILMEEDDSLTLEDLAPYSVFVDISLFQESNKLQYLIENTRKDRRFMTLRFNREVRDTVIIEPFDFEAEGDWFLYEEHVMKDTFVYWITDSLVYKKDSLRMLVTYQASDSLMNLVPFYDTLKFNYREPAKKASRKNKKDEETQEKEETISLTLSNNGRGEQDLHIPLGLVVQHPVSKIDYSRISLVKMQDTLEIPVKFDLHRDSLKLRKYRMNIQWEGLTIYKLNFFPGAFTDIYGLTNDTIPAQFRTRDPEYYGRILLTLSGVDGPKVVQLLDDKGSPVGQKRVSSDGLVEFDYLPPAAFSLKLIHDHNDNGIWDTGDYLDHLQPEGIEFHPGTINIRSNFDVEASWELR